MSILEAKVNALMRLIAADSEPARNEARKEVKRLMNVSANTVSSDPECVVQELLLELGAPDHLIGHPYMVEAIQMVLNDRKYIDNITFGMYPTLAAKFDTTASRVERAMRHLIEVTWNRGDIDVLSSYFGNIVSAEKGKPTNGEFIARCANIVRMRLKKSDEK